MGAITLGSPINSCQPPREIGERLVVYSLGNPIFYLRADLFADSNFDMP